MMCTWGYKTPECFLVVKWASIGFTWSNPPTYDTPGALIGSGTTGPLFRCSPSLDRRHLPGHDLLSSAQAVVVQNAVSWRTLEVETDDLSPLTLRDQQVKCGALSYRCESAEGVCVCVCLKCSGAERTKCTGGLKSCLLLQCLSGFINPFHVNISEFKWWRDYFLTIKL